MRRDVLQAIADPARQSVISLIAVQAITPNAIAAYFHTSRQAVSKHIKIPAECNLLQQQGREIYYYFSSKN